MRTGRSGSGRAIVVVTLALLFGACGDDRAVDGARTAEGDGGAAPSTTAPEPAATEAPGDATVAEGSWAAAELPSCSGRSTYRTRPLYLPGALPDALVLASGGTERLESPGSSSVTRTFTLVDVADDATVRSLIRLTEGAAVGSHATPVDGEPALDTVRGIPGTVQVLTNRSNRPWVHAAWNEQGVDWGAASDRTLGTRGLADALAPLQLHADGVVDPTGRFQVIAEERFPSGDDGAGSFVTTLAIDPSGSDDQPLVRVDIRSRAPGSSGPSPDELGPQASAHLLDGRWVLSSPMAVSVGLDDGSSALVSLRTSTALAQAGSSMSTSTLPGAVVITEEELREIALGVTAADRGASAGSVRVPHYWLDPLADIELCDPPDEG